MQITCIKCDHINPIATGADTEACPRCGVIYAKAQATLARPAMAADSGFRPQAAPSNKRIQTADPFIDRLRADSLYPTFRKVVSIFHVLGQILAAFVFLGGMVGSYKMASLGTMIGATVGAVFMAVLFRVAKEASLMLADMSDATVRLAQRGDVDSSSNGQEQA